VLLGFAADDAYAHAGEALDLYWWRQEPAFLSTPALVARLLRLAEVTRRHGVPAHLLVAAIPGLLLRRTDTDAALASVDAALSKLASSSLPPQVLVRVLRQQSALLLWPQSPGDKRAANLLMRISAQAKVMNFARMSPDQLQEYTSEDMLDWVVDLLTRPLF
jgi:hypothetical protein